MLKLLAFPVKQAGESEIMQDLIAIEKTETGYSAYSPDLLGCVSTGETREEIEQNMREAINFIKSKKLPV